MTKAEVVSLVENSVSSILSKDDVLRLLASIEAEKPAAEKFSEKFRDDMKDAIDKRIENFEKSYVVDADSCEFEINNGNEISLSDFSLDSRYIFGEIWDELRYFLNNYEKETEDEETEE
jgi:hypothetical protein